MSIYSENPREYKTWSGMKQRCYNPNVPGFRSYGGSGVKMCDRWRTSFEAFIQDMGARPGTNYHIHRANSHGDYEPGNCVWIEKKAHAKLPRGHRLKLTKRQTEILEYIASSDISPSYREIGSRFGMSVKGAYDHVTALIAKGVVVKDSGKARSLKVV